MYNLDAMESLAKSRRFAWVANGALQGPNPLCDVAVLNSSEAVVIPTVGAIVPNWVLVIPRRPVLSLSTLSHEQRSGVVQLGEHAASIMGSLDDAVFFEHGPLTSNSPIGCGVDQAHLHVINSDMDFVTSALNDEDVAWRSASSVDAWQALCGSEYYFLRARAGTFVGTPRVRISQFFRRHIAQAAGVPEQWDYRRWPQYNNVRRTYERFDGRLREAA